MHIDRSIKKLDFMSQNIFGNFLRILFYFVFGISLAIGTKKALNSQGFLAVSLFSL